MDALSGAIDPGTPNSDDAALAFSAGVGNAVVAVPEPAVWAPMLAGGLAIGWRTRQRSSRR